MKRNTWVQRLRLGILFIVLALVTYETYMHQVVGGGKAPSVHALCPFGGLESLYQLFATGSLVSKIFTGTMILFGITVVLAFLFRRSFCGLICPFGALQEYSGRLGRKIFKRKFTLPIIVDRPLRYIKYFVMITTIFYAWTTAGLWMNPYDPWVAYTHLSQGLDVVWAEYAVGLIVLILTITGSLLFDRFFCKYLCPMGAFYGIIGQASPFKVVRNDQVCIACGKCNKVCPINIDIQHSSKITSAECINCQTCVINCPADGALNSKGGRMLIKPALVMALVLGLFFGSIAAFQAAGAFEIIPNVKAAGQSIRFSEVKGYMTIKEAAEGTKTEIKEFYHKYKIPTNLPSETQMKNISKLVPEYDFEKIKESFGGTE